MNAQDKNLINLNLKKIECPYGDTAFIALLSEAEFNASELQNESVVTSNEHRGKEYSVLSNDIVVYYHYRNGDVIVFKNKNDFQRIILDDYIKKFGITMDNDENLIYRFEIKKRNIKEFISEKGSTEYTELSVPGYKFFSMNDGSMIRLNSKGSICTWLPNVAMFNRFVDIYIFNK